MNEELEELKHPHCNWDCGAAYQSYQDPTGIYSNGIVDEILVDPRADMFIKRLLSYIEEMKKFEQEVILASIEQSYTPKNEV